MEFMASRPDIVRSGNQRWLLAHWSALRGVSPLPVWSGVDLEALDVPIETLAGLDVKGTSESPRFQIRFHGARVAELHSRPDCVGKFLDEILPPSTPQATLATYHHVVAQALPVYTVSDVRDRAGRIVHYERLLLPFRGDAPGVACILASLETVSPEGPFENVGLMSARPHAFALCTTIHC
jgi:hypothetical protein